MGDEGKQAMLQGGVAGPPPYPALGALKVGLSPVFSLFSTFPEFHLLPVASVGPEALWALHEYINGDTEESVFDNSSGKPSRRCRRVVETAFYDSDSAEFQLEITSL